YTPASLGTHASDWYAHIHPEDRQRVVEGIHAAIDGQGETWQDEYRFRRSDGSYASFLDRGYIARNRDGHPYRMIGSMLDLTQRREMEEALRKSEKRLARAMEIETVGVLFFDSESRFIDANETFLRMIGMNREALERGELSSETVTLPEWMPRTWLALEELYSKGRFSPYEKELMRPDGSRWWGLFAGARLSEDECVEFVVDVTARRRAEEARRESEARFRAVADLVPDLLCRVEPDGAWAWGNRRWMEYTGQHPEQALGFGWADALHPADRGPVLEGYSRAMNSGERFRSEHRIRRSDGEYRWFLAEAVPVCDEDGRITQWFGAATDIHDQREMLERLEALVEVRTQSLAESEERFRLLVTTSAQIIWSTDAEGEFVEDSPTWRAFTGQSAERWLAGEFGEMVHPQDLPDTLTQWRHSIVTRIPFFLEYRLWHAASGKWRWMVVHGIPLRNGRGEVTGWFGTCTDINERKRAEEEVRRMAYSLTMAEQEERRRVSQILHDDLQQLLYGLQLKLRMVRGRLQDGAEPALADTVEDTRQLLKQAINTTRQLTVDLSPPILKSEGLADALEWLQRQMAELHGLRIELRAEKEAVRLDEDLRVLLFQIVRELLFNVIKHAGVDRACVELAWTERCLVIHVADEGQGVESDVLEARERGTGFGLSGIRERLRQVGGRMEFVSRVGLGTCVSLHVPWRSDWT
ncbi:MAG: PAS domain S-box protein, partial [Halomonas sp.]|nr:PAS domain S-box protein [Halomonas sp.]